MPRSLLAALLVVVGLTATLAVPSLARAQQVERGPNEHIVLDELDIAQRQRAKRLWAEIVCDCPRENWSKSLLNCPDGCSEPQKQEVLHQIVEGRSDQEIIDYQIAQHGPRAHGKPDDVLTYLLPFLVLVGAVSVVGVVYARWRRASQATHAHRMTGAPPADDELAAVERELQELR